MFEKKKRDEEPQLEWGSAAESYAQLDALWPRDEAGEREKAVLLGSIPDFNNEADYAINMLMAYGIPAFKNYNNEGSLGKLILGTSAYSASVYVPQSLLEDAKALLEQSAEDAWNEDALDEEAQGEEAAEEEPAGD
jgi:hypothetical protein